MPLSDYWKHIEAICEMLINNTGSNTARWIKLIDESDHFPPLSFDRLLTSLRSLEVSLSSEDKSRIAEKIREKVNHHRLYAGAHWALAPDRVDRLDALRVFYEPADSVARNAWLFRAHPIFRPRRAIKAGSSARMPFKRHAETHSTRFSNVVVSLHF